MMKAFVTCQAAAAEICQQDCASLTGKESSKHGTWCQVDGVDERDLALLAYRCQAAEGVGILLATAPSLEELRIDNSTFESIASMIDAAGSFRVKAHKQMEFEESSMDIASRIGGEVHDVLKTIPVDMRSADLPFIVVVTPEEVLFGLDVVCTDLTIRPYKVFSHPASLNGVLAYTVARLTGIDKDSSVLDPFCDSATIPIEIALWQAGSSPFIYERKFSGLRNPVLKEPFEDVEQELKAITVKQDVFAFEPQLRVMLDAKKNIKLAGVDIECSKVTTDWIDAKFEEHQIDYIVTKPPQISRRNPAEKKIKKMYDEFFYQARYVLKAEGHLGVLMHHPEHILEAAKRHRYGEIARHTVFAGKQPMTLIVFRRGDSNGL